MRIISSAQELNSVISQLKENRKKIGFVPTMGYLHKGHLSLVRRVRKKCDAIVVSIFVNPTQFGPKEDLARYPRNLKRDCAMLKKERVDCVFVPEASDIYPKGLIANVSPGPLARGLCGAKRPGHFKGVATVVKRLFEMVKPDVAVFGQKDYQQARVIQELVKRHRMNIEIEIAPIVREKDGLAMSSRNVYLSSLERRRAIQISKTLELGKKLIKAGERDAQKIERQLIDRLSQFVDSIDYVKVLNVKDLSHRKRVSGKILVAIACFVGRTRLIDNCLIRV